MRWFEWCIIYLVLYNIIWYYIVQSAKIPIIQSHSLVALEASESQLASWLESVVCKVRVCKVLCVRYMCVCKLTLLSSYMVQEGSSRIHVHITDRRP